MIKCLRGWWRRRRWSHPEIKKVSYYESQAEVPERLPADTLAVVGTAERPKWAILKCPCGRGHVLTVNLSRMRRPRWRLAVDDAGPTLSPSIDYVGDHRCHFWLREGRVSWARGWPWRE